jgi:type II secretory ATPase GspE/PulE/Tfp pilus assembly ATPase PilB-like protein
MVGEMRDEETASVAASASLSGQLVFTTLHSNDAPKAIDRFVDLGVSRQTIAAGLSAIVAQRLVRKLCMYCRCAYEIQGPVASEFGLADGTRGYRATGCRVCGNSGYAGRAAIFECLFVDERMRHCIAESRPSIALAELARQHGYETMVRHGIRRALAGDTTFEELRRVLAVDGAA